MLLFVILVGECEMILSRWQPIPSSIAVFEATEVIAYIFNVGSGIVLSPNTQVCCNQSF